MLPQGASASNMPFAAAAPSREKVKLENPQIFQLYK